VVATLNDSHITADLAIDTLKIALKDIRPAKESFFTVIRVHSLLQRILMNSAQNIMFSKA